jgi:ABC-2 type transport system ATP-binding protein
MLLGLVTPTAGEGKLLGATLGDVRVRAKIGFLPEHFRFHDWLTGREFLGFHGRLYGLHGAVLTKRIEMVLARVELVDAADRKLREYSKGMLQRIGLAMSLLNHPKIVFLDEPTSGLDPMGRLLVRDIIGELRRDGTSVFLNSHLLSEIEVTCDRVVFLRRGHVVRSVDLHQTQNFDHRMQVVELQLDRVDSAVLLGLSQFSTHIDQVGDVIHMHITDKSRLPEIARWVVGQGLALSRLVAHRPTLEQIFIETMAGERHLE